MLILTAFATFLFQITQPPYPPLPPRAYQPNLVDPGIDGERAGGSRNGDLTPDGKVLIAYRNTKGPTGVRYALTAAVVRPERLKTNSYGYLTGFYDLVGTAGENLTFGTTDITPEPPAEAEQAVIHYLWEPSPPCTTGGASGTQDPNLPIEVNPHLTVALKPLPDGNPFRSNATGNPQNGGPYSCYKLWILRLHSPGYAGYLQCAFNPGANEPLKVVAPDNINPEYRYVCQDVTVVIDEATRSVVHASLDSLPYQDLRDVNGQFISGFEPSITGDGKLVLYHGDASGTFHPGDGNVTYIYNPNGPQPTGWTAPRSITELPTFTDIPGGLTAAQQAEQFKLRYRLFAQPIRMAPISLQPGDYPYEDGYVFADGTSGPADTVRGLYLWVSKDGSFFLASSAGATEAESDPPTQGPRTRAGNYICGDITGGYVKHIDDVGINPTRRGGPWNWPPREAATMRDSWRTMQVSTGLKPGLWEPMLGAGASLPTQIASTRIPVLPVFETSIDSYGEIRCEEMDGNYLLYLACNESLMLNDELADYEEEAFERSPVPGECDVIFDLRSTPDTSGRPIRARSTLNVGAAFPQEVLGSSALLRSAIGAALGPGLGLGSGVSLHECVGFKGQGIVFNATGNVITLGAPSLAGMQRFTVQAFVKMLGPLPSSTLTLFEWGGVVGPTVDPVVTLKLDTSGKFIAQVSTLHGSVSAQSRLGAVPFNQSMANSRSGWRHVAFTFDGDSGGSSRLKLYLDGQLEKTSAANPASVVRTPAGVKYYAAGPGRTAPNAVDDTDKMLILDEIAVSDVVRTTHELRRDAYVPALAEGFVDWPTPGPSLPMELDATEARWPAGITYDPDVVALGALLFDDGILSLSGSNTCSQCHIPSEHFADQGQPVVAGVLNFPTLFNAAFGTHKFFDGSAASLEAQVWRPILGTEMGPQTVTQVLDRIHASPLAGEFTDPDTFNEPADQENVAQAVAMYVRTLNSGGSPWDNELYARKHGGVHFGGIPVMNSAQRAGAGLFFGKARCVACHRGTSFTDDDFHNVLTVETSEGNKFRGDFTNRANEDGRIKTPTLRNVQHTGPYFHDGSKATLHDVILHYNSPPFGATGLVGTADIDLRPLELTAQEMSDLEAFLNSLSGTIP